MKGTLILEDGTCFEGVSIGVPGQKIGKIIFNTSVVGYQEIMTDPANAGKIVVLTYPLIGNYGVASKFYESGRCRLGALVIKEESKMHSNWQAEGSLRSFIKKEKVSVISELDTRTLTVKIRDSGEQYGIIATGNFNKSDLLRKLKDYKKNKKNDYINGLSTPVIKRLNTKGSGPRIAVLDLGILNSFLKQLEILGCSITLLPYSTPSEKILELKPDGLIISCGPEEDLAIPGIIKTVKKLIGKIPMLGISAGHEIIAAALNGKIKKMKLGHHGVNYPVKSPSSYKGEITVQNHSLVVDESSLKRRKGLEITLRNVNDNTIEEMQSKSLKFLSTQYYPACPDTGEVNEVFERFLGIIGKKKGKSHAKT